jgi:hypothetical protein
LPPEEAGPDLFLAGGGDLRTLLPEPLKGFLTGDLGLFSLPWLSDMKFGKGGRLGSDALLESAESMSLSLLSSSLFT